jgi:hypothetical protein
MKIRGLKIFVILAYIITSQNIKAQDIPKEVFCQSLTTVISNQTNVKKISVLQAFQILYLTRTLITPKELPQDDVVYENHFEDEGEKLVFVNLPSTQFDQQEIDRFKKLKKEITHLRLFKKLKKNQEEQQCLKNIEQHPEDYKKFVKFINESNSKKELQENYKNSRLMSLALHQLKSFKRKGWKIKVTKNLFEFYEQIESNTKISQIILVNHSDELGRLYDAEKTIFPKGSFSNLPPNIKRLIIFSCHPLEVIKHYQISSITKKLSYYYPEVNENFKDFFGENIPVLAIRSLMKLNRKALPDNFNTNYNCSFEIKGTKDLKNIVFSVNDNVISAGEIQENQITKFDCNLLLTSKNIIKIYYLNSLEKNPIGILALYLHTPEQSKQEIPLTEYLSADKTRHLVTIGTIGGKP